MPETTFLNLTISPHRSLSKKGFKILMLIVTILCLTGGIIFWFLGAWPVFGFFGLDIVLIYIAFKVSYRRGEIYERLSIVSEKFKISRGFPSGKLQEWELNPYWAKVELITQNKNTQLLIRSGDKVVSIGSFLNQVAKENLKDTISKSIHKYRATNNI